MYKSPVSLSNNGAIYMAKYGYNIDVYLYIFIDIYMYY